MGLVQRRADEVVHPGIDDDEGPALPALEIDDAGHQDAGIAHDQAAGLEDQLAAEAMCRALDDRRIGLRIRRRLVVLAIRDAETAAEVDVADGMAVGAQAAHEVGDEREGIVERREIGDLAADMHVDAGDLEPRQLGGVVIDLAGATDRDAELVLGLAGRDLGVGLGVDVRIDPHGDARSAPLAHGERRDERELRLGLDIDAEDPFVEGERELGRGLADAGEHDLAGSDTGGARALELAARDHVRTGAERGQRLDHRLVGVRLHGVADQRVDIGEGAGEHLVVTAQRGGRIAIERGADGRRELDEIDRLGVQHAVAIGEMMHARLIALSAAVGTGWRSAGRRRGSLDEPIDRGPPLGTRRRRGRPTIGAQSVPALGGGHRRGAVRGHVLVGHRRVGGRIEAGLAPTAGKAERGGECTNRRNPGKPAVEQQAQVGHSPSIRRIIAEILGRQHGRNGSPWARSPALTRVPWPGP